MARQSANYPPELRERAVRMVAEVRVDYPSAWAFRGANATTVTDGATDAGVHGAYLHTHAAAHPGAASRFVAAASKLGR